MAIVERYDASATPGSARLIDISNRGFVGTGGNIMIPGFVVSSEGPKTFLIRAIGPTLAGFGVAGMLADPVLTVVRSRSWQRRGRNLRGAVTGPEKLRVGFKA